jgi:L-cysteine S-thiosulfotransferase
MNADTQRGKVWAAAIGVAVFVFTIQFGQSQPAPADDDISEYRAMFGDDNPAELWELRGQELWTSARGPNKVALSAACDFGLGAGVIKGAYAQLPRYFADTKRVQDMESRLLTCMVKQQGFTEADVLKNRFGDGDRKSDLEALSAYIVDQSRGVAISLPMKRAEERKAFEDGKAIFYYRAGTHDFSCATCHGTPDKRIRLQRLPDLASAEGARDSYTAWPAYRISQGEVRTMEWRLGDCFRQQRLPELSYGSEAAIALTMFLAKTAEGGVMAAPGLKR